MMNRKWLVRRCRHFGDISEPAVIAITEKHEKSKAKTKYKAILRLMPMLNAKARARA